MLSGHESQYKVITKVHFPFIAVIKWLILPLRRDSNYPNLAEKRDYPMRLDRLVQSAV